jgi:hypothetical protein
MPDRYYIKSDACLETASGHFYRRKRHPDKASFVLDGTAAAPPTYSMRCQCDPGMVSVGGW